MRNHYEILDVPRDASADRIKAAYRFQLKAFHPDKFPEGSEHAQNAQQRIQQVVEAHRTLSQASSRAEYDRFLNHTSPLAIGTPQPSAEKIRTRRGPPIYVSATDELESAEALTLTELAALGCRTMTRPGNEVQSDLRPAIRAQINQCRAVVQLVGCTFGEEPPTIDPTFGRVSYTQFEAMYARLGRKRVHHILFSDKFPVNAVDREPSELRSLQTTYRRRLQIVDTHSCPVIDNPEALRAHLRELEETLRAQSNTLLWVLMAAAVFILVGVWFLPAERNPPPSVSKKLETTLVRSESVQRNDATQARENIAPPPQDVSPPTTTVVGSTFDLPAIARNARKAVLTIRAVDSKGRTMTGTGFFISEDGRLVTNRHVIKGATRAEVRTEDGAIYLIPGALTQSDSFDLAVLKAEAKQVPFLEIQPDTPEIGSRVAIIGSPRALEGSLSEGIVSAIRAEGDGTWIQITAPISPGSSGSPVLNGRGKVIGVATLNSGGRFQNLNFARSSQDLTLLVERIPKGAKPRLLSDLPEKENTQPSTPPPATYEKTYRVSGLPVRTPFLNVRKGPGAHFAIVVVLPATGSGITLGPGRRNNGATVWQEIYLGSYHGWVNAEYLAPEAPDTAR